MYYVTLFIHEEFSICCLTLIKRHKTQIVAKDVIESHELFNQLNSFIKKYLPSQRNNVICRIVLPLDWVIKRSLQLPNIALMPYEIDTYVKHSLAKIFHTDERLIYDYEIEVKPALAGQDKQLMVYACQYDLVQAYFTQAKSLKINFIGIPTFLWQQSSTTLTDHTIVKVINCTNLTGINFLPWRDQERQQKRYHFLQVMMGYLFVLIMISFLLVYLEMQKLDQQNTQNQQLQTQYLQATTELASLIDLDKHNKQLQWVINEQKKSTKQFEALVNYFTLISTIIPKNMWLDSLEYQNNMMKLKGKSFLYADILRFTRQLNEHHLVKMSKITAIKRHTFLLQFYINTHFIDNESQEERDEY